MRGSIRLPFSMDSTARLLVFTTPNKVEAAKAAGATFAGGEELIDPIIEGKLDFNRCIASKEMLPVVMKLARYLGPKGLMPNAKAGTAELICSLGTLTSDLENAIAESFGSIPFKVERYAGLVNIAVAKLSFEPEQIRANVVSALEKIQAISPEKRFIACIHLSMHGHPGVLVAKACFEKPEWQKTITGPIELKPIVTRPPPIIEAVQPVDIVYS